MSSFTVLLLCIQACLVQNVFSQACRGAYGPAITPAVASSMVTGRYGVAGPWGSASGMAIDGIGYSGAGLAGRGLAFDGITNPAAIGYGAAPYGGAGEGNVAVAGELPVAGTTAVAGQVPIMGTVGFGGDVCASGAVSISGQCACGCGAPNGYLY